MPRMYIRAVVASVLIQIFPCVLKLWGEAHKGQRTAAEMADIVAVKGNLCRIGISKARR